MAYALLKAAGDSVELEPDKVALVGSFSDGSFLVWTNSCDSGKGNGNFYLTSDHSLSRQIVDVYNIGSLNNGRDPNVVLPFELPHSYVRPDFLDRGTQFRITNNLVDWSPASVKKVRVDRSVLPGDSIHWHSRDITTIELVAGGTRFYRFMANHLRLYILVTVSDKTCIVTKYYSETDIDRTAMEGNRDALLAHPNYLLADRAQHFLEVKTSSFKKFQQFLKHEIKETQRRAKIK